MHVFKIKDPFTKEVIKTFEITDKQFDFITSDKRYSLYSGGFGAGKTFALILKAINVLQTHPKNTILMGRQHYQDLRDTVQAEFFNLLPEIWLHRFVKSERKAILVNGSEVLFRHLDKVSEKEVRSLNLGGFAIDQVEDVSEPVYMALKGRLRKHNTSQQGFMTSNPAPTWVFREFKQQQKPENLLIETSTLDNPHLTKEYVEDLLRYPDYWKKQFVFGEWNTAIMGDRNVYHLDIIAEQEKNIITPDKCKYFEDIRLYYEEINPLHVPQMGVDVSEGIGGDASVLSITNQNTGEELAFWQGQLSPDLLVEKALRLLKHINKNLKRKTYLVPEINGLGVAFITHIKKRYSNIYKREVFLKQSRERKQVLGWKTSTSTKPLLINNHVDLLRNGKIIIHTPEVLEQMKTFVYTDDAKKSGMGADPGFHDDAVIGHALSCFFDKPTLMRLLSTETNKIMSGFPTKKAFNPIAPKRPWVDIFDEKSSYDWMTDSKKWLR